jgi:hypothetical protein
VQNAAQKRYYRNVVVGGMPTYAMRSVCKLSRSNAAFSLVKKNEGEGGKTNTNVRMAWWNRTICSVLTLNFTASRVTYKKSNYPFTFIVHLPTVFHVFVTTVSKLKMCDFSGETFKGFWSAIIFYEYIDDATAVRQCILQTGLWTLYLLKVHLQSFFLNQ